MLIKRLRMIWRTGRLLPASSAGGVFFSVGGGHKSSFMPNCPPTLLPGISPSPLVVWSGPCSCPASQRGLSGARQGARYVSEVATTGGMALHSHRRSPGAACSAPSQTIDRGF